LFSFITPERDCYAFRTLLKASVLLHDHICPGSVAWHSVKGMKKSDYTAAGTIMEPCHGSDSGSKQPFENQKFDESRDQGVFYVNGPVAQPGNCPNKQFGQ